MFQVFCKITTKRARKIVQSTELVCHMLETQVQSPVTVSWTTSESNPKYSSDPEGVPEYHQVWPNNNQKKKKTCSKSLAAPFMLLKVLWIYWTRFSNYTIEHSHWWDNELNLDLAVVSSLLEYQSVTMQFSLLFRFLPQIRLMIRVTLWLKIGDGPKG